MSQVKPFAASGSFVALVEDGIPRFSKNPVRHADNASALKEARRLSERHPGQLFQVFGPRVKAKIIVREGEVPFMDMVAYVEPKPAGISGKELHEAAPEGTYRMVGQSLTDQALFFVLENGGNRCVMYQGSEFGHLEAMHPTSWNDSRFELVKFPGVTIRLSATKRKGFSF